ncbi:ABC transporter permease [Cumulibacter soli]|uniref:ABC transporter permease n=1 Tax=Cumulibacter soli TaxID=2546344 RepID=UPI001ABB9C82|nr:ABC transporter permease [Cumulibacter soli]
MWTWLKSDKRALISAIYLVFLLACLILAPLISTGTPDLQGPQAFLGFGEQGHLLGTDDVGRDLWTRLLYGGRTSLLASLTAVITSIILGIPLGLIAGYFGGWVDTVLMRIVDTLLAFPALVLAIGVSAALGGGLTMSMIAVGIVFTPVIARIVRGQVLSIRKRLFVEVAETYGATRMRAMWRHVLPNSLRPIVVQSALLFATGILAEASLSFLGLGVEPPTASWGSMMRSAFDFLSIAPNAIYPPGIALVLTVLAVNSLVDAGADRWEGIGTRRKRRGGTAGSTSTDMQASGSVV